VAEDIKQHSSEQRSPSIKSCVAISVSVGLGLRAAWDIPITGLTALIISLIPQQEK
jgi:hypothetical protein